jgi:uncharacterized protein YqjF (DUF2071 family)
MKFLTARWSNLFLATYAVPEELLRPRLPSGLELDRRDGQCFVSLVAFDFRDTRVLGVPWPGFRHFPEVNLRFYVRWREQRGVIFLREFVPQRFVARMARTLYNEPYLATPMSSIVKEEPESIHVEHRIAFGGRTHTLAATGARPGFAPVADTVEHFFKEHEWGFGVVRGRLRRYRVEHTVWEVYPVRDFRIDIDWATLYGTEWAVLQGATPCSTILAAGSPVIVYTGEPLAT